MSNRKLRKEQPKLGHAAEPSCPRNICFSFCYLTANGSFNFDYFNSSQKRECETIKASLYDRLEELSKYKWIDLMALPKGHGFETIPVSRLKFQPSEMDDISGQKAIVFRFKGVNGKDCRIIGIKEDHCSAVCHVIGYDFDYSAYDHGS